MPAASTGITDTMAENEDSLHTVTEGSAGTATSEYDTTFDAARRRSSARWLGPLLGGLFITLVVICTLATAVMLGAQEGMLVAGVESREGTATPSPVLPSATPIPSATPSPSTTLLLPSPTVSPVATTVTSCPMPSGWQLHVVQSGETLSTIGAVYHASASLLYQINCLQSTALSPGQAIYVPGIPPSTPTRAPARAPTATSRPRCYVRTDWFIYIVQRGDTLSSIARRVNTSVQDLMRGNCLVSDLILAGQQLRVPNLPPPPPPPPPTATKKPTALPPTATDLPTSTPTTFISPLPAPPLPPSP